MKKIIIFIVLLSTVLIGCERSTKTIENLEYTELIKTSSGDILQFKDSEGYKHNYFISSEKSFNLEKNKIYSVEITVSTFSQNRDFVYSVKGK